MPSVCPPSRILAVIAIVACLLSATTPARANLFGNLKNSLKHAEPSPPPAGSWNFVSTPFKPFSYPDVDEVSVEARCRYVAPQAPYQWQFRFTNLTGKPVKFRVALVQINTQAFATVRQHFSKVESTSIQRVGLAPHRASAIVEDGRYGCPGMPGGVNKDKHYVVMLDDFFVGTQVVSSGVFERYDREIDDEHAQYSNNNNENVSEAATAGVHDGLEFINAMPNYEVPEAPAESE